MYAGKDLFHPSLDPPDGKFSFDGEYGLLRAARWRGYTWEQFDLLDSDAQARVVAEYRIEQRFQAVDSWANRPKAPPPNHGTNRSHPRRRRRR